MKEHPANSARIPNPVDLCQYGLLDSCSVNDDAKVALRLPGPTHPSRHYVRFRE
jgi:hypothetical protein